MKQKNLLTRMLLLFALVVGSVTSVWAENVTSVVDFENELSTYSDWTFTDLTRTNSETSGSGNSAITTNPYGGNYFAKTSQSSGSWAVTKEKIASPVSCVCYYSKTTSNTNANSGFYIQVSTDGTTWTDVATGNKMNNVTGGTWYELNADLTKYSNVYVRVYYKGTSAVRALDDITLTYVADTRVDATWTIDPASATVTVGENVTLALTTNYDGELSFSSSNSDIATVSYASPTITINGLKKGSTTINVTGNATDTYKAISKTIEVTVKKVLPSSAIFYESFDVNKGTGGNDDSWSGSIALSDVKTDNKDWTFTTGYGASECVRIGSGNASGSAISPAIGVYGDVSLSFMMGSWKGDTNDGYIDIVNGGEFDANNVGTRSNNNKTIKISIEKEKWTTFELKLNNITPNTKIKFYHTGSKRLFLDEVLVTADATFNINSACTDETKYFGTFSNSNAFVIPEALTVSEVGVESGKLKVQDYESGAVVPANTGVMVSAENAGTYAINFSSEAGTSILGDNNYLKASGAEGIDATAMATAAPSCTYYRLTMHNGTQIGFWWGAEDGAAFALAANKAYLAVPTAEGAPALGLWVDGETTDIKSLTPALSQGEGVYYDLSGRRVAQPTKGLYIVNGKKVLVK